MRDGSDVPLSGRFRARLLSDTEPPEYLAEQIFAAERAGDLRQYLVRESQVFGHQLKLGIAGVVLCLPDMHRGPAQRLNVTRTRDEHPIRLPLPASAAQ